MEIKKEIKTKRNTFSLVSDIAVEESMVFNAELKLQFQPIPFKFSLTFIKDIIHFQYFQNQTCSIPANI